MPNDSLRKQLEPIIPRLFEDHPRSSTEYFYDVRFLYRDGKLQQIKRLAGELVVKFDRPKENIDYLA